MKAYMSDTAWQAGLRNAGIYGGGVLASWLLLTLFFILVMHQSFRTAIGLGFFLLWLLSCAAFLISFLLTRHAGGVVLLDCGYRPMRWLFFVNAVMFLLLFFSTSSVPFSGTNSVALRITFALSATVFYIIIGNGRLQVRAQGIWAYTGLLKWPQIKSYRWQDSTLVIKAYSKIPFLGRGALPFPAECQEAVQAVLQEHEVPQEEI